MGYLRRRAITALLAANAIKPGLGYDGPQGSLLPWPASKILGFAAGWPTGELAPQLLAATAVDTAQAVVRGRSSRTSLAVAAVGALGLAHLIRTSTTTNALAETALAESLGEAYVSSRASRPEATEHRLLLREVARPFALRGHGVDVIRNVNYQEGGRRARLDIYRPTGIDLTDAPVLVQVHGGAWMIGNKRQQALPLMNRMAARGWVCVAINYRLAPRNPWPAQIIDVKKAIAWTRENIARYGGDPTYIVATGGSAGGHLAALAALTPQLSDFQPGFEEADTSVSACVSFYGVYDLAGISGDRASVDLRDRLIAPLVMKLDPTWHQKTFERASPLTHVAPDAPDFFVLHGTADTVVSVNQGRVFARRLKEVSEGIVTYLELPGAQHGFDLLSSIRSQHAVRAVERWLEWHRSHRRTSTSARPANNLQESST